MTWLIFDAAILVIFAIFCIVGSIKGFVKMVMRVFGRIGALILAYFFSDRVADIINQKYIGPYFNGLFSGYIQKIAEASEEQLAQTIADIPEAMKTAIALLGYDLEELAAGIRSSESIAASAQQISEPISNLISGVLAFAAVFVGVLALAAIVTLILNALSKLPVINTVNKWLGLALGAVEGLLVIFVVVFVFNALLPYLQSENILGLAGVNLTETHIYKFISEINPLNMMLQGFIGGK